MKCRRYCHDATRYYEVCEPTIPRRQAHLVIQCDQVWRSIIDQGALIAACVHTSLQFNLTEYQFMSELLYSHCSCR